MKRRVETLRRIQNLIHFGIVYSQKFVCSSDSVGIIMLSFRAFLDDELIHRFIFWFAQDKYFGYLKENFSESCRTTLDRKSVV